MKSDVVGVRIWVLNPKKKLSKEVEEDLIAENQRLRMENEYLKN